MRVVVVGATGNVGTSVLAALAEEHQVESVLGVARRRPELQVDKVEWAEADVASSDLVPLFRGADAVVHLAWLIQPSRDLDQVRRVTSTARSGSSGQWPSGRARAHLRLFRRRLLARAQGPPRRRVVADRRVPSSFYGRHKAAVERLLDRFSESSRESESCA